MKLFGRSLIAATLVGLLGIAACSKSGPSDDTGSLGIALELPGAITLNSASYAITGPNGFTTSGTIPLTNALMLTATIGGIPAATGYTISITATATDGTTMCAGHATFDVIAHAVSQAVVEVDCREAPQTGSVQVSGTFNICPLIDAIGATPASGVVGGTVALSATAHDPDNGPQALSYQWTATSGTLSSATVANPTFTCTAAGLITVTLTVSDGDQPCNDTLTETVNCAAAATGAAGAGGGAAGAAGAGAGGAAGAAGAPPPPATLAFTVDPAATVDAVTINQGTAIGEGSLNGATPFTLTNLAADPKNTQTITSATNPFLSTGNVPDTASGFCDYSVSPPKRVSYVTGAKFETTAPGIAGADPMVPMAPFYFPLVYTTTNTTKGNAFGGKSPIIGLFDWRPKDIDEALVAAESDDNGKTWFFMQTVLELFPDLTNPISGGFSATATATGCPPTVGGTNASSISANGSSADNGWGHATIIQLPGPSNVTTGQFLYLLDRNDPAVDVNPLFAINLTGSSNKFPIWNTNNTSPGNNDIKSIGSALNNSAGTAGTSNAIGVKQTVGLLNPDGIMAVFPLPPNTPAGTPVTVLYVQKILNGDSTGSTALPVAQRCNRAPFSGKTNDDISNVRLATTTDGVTFTDLGVVQGLNDPTTVDYTQTRWVSPRGTLIDINGDGSKWGLLFSGGNCLDGDSDAFHFIGYAESTDMMHWTVSNGIQNPIASINTITTANQAGGASVTVPATAPLVPTQPWFAQRLYAPTATQIDPTHLSMTFAGYGVQTPNNNLLNYRQIGNVVLTVSQALPPGVPNNINTH